MEGDSTNKKDIKVQIPSATESISNPNRIEFQGTPVSGQATLGLARQQSVGKTNCLCSPTTHAGSFRCRIHRSPSLQRTKSIDSGPLPDHTSIASPSNVDVTGDTSACQNH